MCFRGELGLSVFLNCFVLAALCPRTAAVAVVVVVVVAVVAVAVVVAVVSRCVN